MKKKLSFVLPVYKVEKYLPQCLDSIFSQITDCCEVVLIDDGSPDNSGAICDDYAARYENVTVVHIPNGGNSAARNLGVERSTGEYILFVDSDDFIAPGSVKKILDWTQAHQADVCFLETVKAYPDGTTVPLGEGLTGGELRGMNRLQVLEFMARCPKYPGGPWAKLLRREFLLEQGIRFPGDRRLCEDLFYTLDIYLAAERFDGLDFPYYNYRQSVAGSITSTITPRYYFDKARFVTYAAENFSEGKKPLDEAAACVLSFAAYEYAILVWDLRGLTGADREKAMAFLKEYRWILKYGKNSRTKLVCWAVRLLGIQGASGLLKAYMSRR